MSKAHDLDQTGPFRILQAAKDQVAQLSSAIADAERLIGSTPQWSAIPLGQQVRRLIAMRCKRNAAFPAGLFGDPAWDILLELLASELEGRSVTISDACNCAAVPTTTALRHIHALVKRGIVERTLDVHDRRRSLLRLSHASRLAMLDILQVE